MHLKHHLWTSLWEYLGKLFWFVWVEMGLGLGFGWKCLAWWILRITIAYSWFCVCFFDPFGDVPKKNCVFKEKSRRKQSRGAKETPFNIWQADSGVIWFSFSKLEGFEGWEPPNPPPKKNSWVFNKVGTFKVGRLLILDMFGGSKTTTLLGDLSKWLKGSNRILYVKELVM